MLELAVLADDLTGGMIIAAKLEADGVVCPLVTDPGAVAGAPESTAIVLARKIRLVPAADAQAEALAGQKAFAERRAQTLYYKYSGLFDSTDRGNIGPIADALLEATGAARTIFCPVYIDRGLTLYQGHIFIASTLMSESAKRFDPMTPATTSDVVAKLRAQTKTRVGLIEHQRLTGSVAAIATHLQGLAETPFWVADAVDEADVAKLAALTRGWPLVTGADSLAPAILRDRRGAGAAPEPGSGRRLLRGTPGHAAVIAGSCGQATMRQLERFEERHPVRWIDLVRESDDPGLADSIAAWAAERLRAGPVAIATTATPENVAAAQAAFGREGASRRADRALGEVAVRLASLGVRKFVVAGGETSGEVLAALGVERLEVAAYDNELFGGYCRGGDPTPISFVLKPGSMGGPDFFFSALDRMIAAER